jgi:hypothetical protein
MLKERQLLLCTECFLYTVTLCHGHYRYHFTARKTKLNNLAKHPLLSLGLKHRPTDPSSVPSSTMTVHVTQEIISRDKTRLGLPTRSG